MASVDLSKYINILVPTGSLGAGVREEELEYGLAQGAHAIASDAGSTDSGAAYLAKGTSKNNRAAVKRDLEMLMKAQQRASIPIIIGTSGQAGGDMNVDWTRDIVIEIANEMGIQPKVALLYAEQDKGALKAFNAAGKIKPLAPLGPLDDATIDDCAHIVVAMGAEPFIKALEDGADIILGGRATDTAVLASFALWKGAPWGPSWHAGKTGECGVQCTVDVTKGSGVLLRVGPEDFIVEPLSTDNRCDVHSVSAHMLYENSDPFRLTEPGGVLDVTEARYAALDDRVVRVTGSRWEKHPYTLKLEGASGGKYQTLMLVGIQDPDVLDNVDAFHDKLLDALIARVDRAIGRDVTGEYDISLRMYGWNGLTGEKPPEGTPPPREVAMMFVATADTQDMATQIARCCNPYFFHFPMHAEKELPSYGFPFTPADVERGQVYEFKLNHVVATDDPLDLVRMEWVDWAAGRGN